MIEQRNNAGGVAGDGTSLTGLVTPFNTETTIGDMRKDGFREQIAPGAFTKTLQERDVVMLWNHNSDMPLARTSAGNLTLRSATDGLRAEATPVQTSYGKDALELTKSGVVRGMSFGFEVVKDTWTDDEGREATAISGTRRTIQEVKLHEVSAVTFPAYETTTLSARSAAVANDAVRAAAKGVREAAEDMLAYLERSGAHDEARTVRMAIDRAAIARLDERAEKYNADDRKHMASAGQAMPDGSFPIKDAEDLKNAIHAVGRASNNSHNAVRKHIIARAKALGLSSDIPDNWNADGSLKEQNSVEPSTETRDVVDGDDPNAAFYEVWSNGAGEDLMQFVGTGQLPPGVEDALNQIHAWCKGMSENVSATDGHGAVEEHASEDFSVPEEDLARVRRLAELALELGNA